MASDASVQRNGTTLRFSGVLDRAAAVALWPLASKQLAGVQQLDLGAVPRIDSAGLALLAELAARARQSGQPLTLAGEPAGLNELGAAYRLAPGLDFTASPAAS